MYFTFMIMAISCGVSSHVRAEEINKAALDDNSAVIFTYHRFGENRFPTTNTTLSQFRVHLDILKNNNYTVLSLDKIIDAYEQGTTLPNRVVALTVDDAYRSFYENAWPLLQEYGFPVTIFVSTDPVDRASKSSQSSNYMTWDMLRDLHNNGALISNHTASHLHMITASKETNIKEIEKSQQRFQDELGFKPDIFAYPYGEYNLAARQIIVDMGFRAAFGQHSGVSHGGADIFTLPRFAINEQYGDAKSFTLRANALAFPMADMIPLDPYISPENNPPAFGFTIDKLIRNPKNTTCYRSKQLEITWLGSHRAEIRFETPFNKGRTRINCTLLSEGGRWRWFSAIFYVPH